MSSKASKGQTPQPNPLNNRTRLIAANWKMNHNHLEGIQAVQKLYYHLKDSDYRFAEIAIFPPFTDLRSLQLLIESDRMSLVLGAQNCYFETSGAFTGEISPLMLAKLNVKYVILGHSERRTIFMETDEVVAKKVKAVFDAQMIPLLCVGETLQQREARDTGDVLRRQVKSVAEACSNHSVSSLVIAYEPIWAIGTGVAASPEDAGSAAEIIRTAASEALGGADMGAMRVLYGGSINGSNAKDFLAESRIDGLLVGGASLEADSLVRVIQSS